MDNRIDSRFFAARASAGPGFLLGLAGCLILMAGCAPTAHDLGLRALENDDYEGAIAQFDASLAGGEDRFEALRDRGAARYEAGDLEGALVDLEAAAEIETRDARLQWLIGRTNSGLENYDAAAEAYRQYRMLVSSKSIRKHADLRLGQLRTDAAEATATHLLETNKLGISATPNSLMLYTVRPFDRDQPTEQDLKFCRALSDWIATDLAKVAALESIAPNAVELYYRAQGIDSRDRWQFDPASLVSRGNIQPARHMVQGEFGAAGRDQAVLFGISCDTNSGTVRDCPYMEDDLDRIFEMETQFVLGLLDSLGIETTPEERLAIGEKPTRDLRAFIAYGDGLYRLWDLGDEEGAARSFRQAVSYDPGFVMAADAAASVEAKSQPDRATVEPPPPPEPQPQTERAMASAGQLGLGLIPAAENGDAQSAATENIVTARGTATVIVRVEVR